MSVRGGVEGCKVEDCVGIGVRVSAGIRVRVSVRFRVSVRVRNVLAC